MKKCLLAALVFSVLMLACKSKRKGFSDRVRENFLSHVKKIDSTLVLDSFRILKVDTINRRMERIFDDTLYMMEFHRVEKQLSNAIQENKKDSMEFYQGEVNYMKTQFDSLQKEIALADTTKKLGMVAVCSVRLTKDTANREMIVYYFLDWNMKVWNPEMIDSAIFNLSKKMN
jgi:hypothetical protein